jgi:hypothetical protein
MRPLWKMAARVAFAIAAHWAGSRKSLNSGIACGGESEYETRIGGQRLEQPSAHRTQAATLMPHRRRAVGWTASGPSAANAFNPAIGASWRPIQRRWHGGSIHGFIPGGELGPGGSAFRSANPGYLTRTSTHAFRQSHAGHRGRNGETEIAAEEGSDHRLYWRQRADGFSNVII